MRCRFFRPSTLGPTLGFEALEVGRPVVDEGHRLGQGAVSRHLGDRPVHLLRHPSIGGVALRPGAQRFQAYCKSLAVARELRAVRQ